jgi:hypothetical protein
VVDAAPPIPKPVREQGYAYPSGLQFWIDLTQEETPELRWPLAPWVYDRMRRQDSQVGSTLRAVISPITRTQTRVNGRGCRDEVTEFVATNLGLPIVGAEDEDFTEQLRGRDRFSWPAHKRLACLMLPFGHSYFEQVYRYDEDTKKFRLRKLAPRLPKSIAQVNVARDGGLISIQQWDSGAAFANITSAGFSGGTGAPINVNRLVAYVLEREGGNWLGQSLLRTAYKNWLLKDRALRTWSQLIDRQGMGIPDYEGAENETDLSSGLDIATSVRAVEDLVDINFGSSEPAPQLVDDPIGTSQTELDRVRDMAGLGSDADLVRFLRTVPNLQEAA